MIIRDLLYFDLDKALSLLSQLEGGISKEMQESFELQSTRNLDGRANAAFIKAGGQKGKSERSLRVETKVQHHDLLSTLEDLLFQNGFALDLNDAAGDQHVDGKLLRKLLEGVSYVRAEGLASIEDFSRLQRLASKMNWVADFVNRCAEKTIKESPEYVGLKNQIDDRRKAVNQIKDRNRKSVLKAKINAQEKSLNNLLGGLISEQDQLDDWLVDGLSKWIDLFNRDQIHFRINPFAVVLCQS